MEAELEDMYKSLSLIDEEQEELKVKTPLVLHLLSNKNSNKES